MPEDAGDGRFVRRRAARAYEADRLYRQHRARRHHRREGALRRAEADRIAGAALDFFDQEPTPQYNLLPTLPKFVAAPHVAGVTREAVDRMGVAAVENILSVLDGKPIRNNIVNEEVLV
ncbi:MAG TPA: NAD(P)-dependent oxidoreductase [Stellaceae bacterium]|nr:NAD(P)-dependent oxidoreductase [Stellaceae bacterium]